MSMSSRETAQEEQEHQAQKQQLEDAPRFASSEPGTSSSTKNKKAKPSPLSLPPHRQRRLTLAAGDENGGDGVAVDVVLQLFTEYVFVVVTQLNGKMGPLFRCAMEEDESSLVLHPEAPKRIYSISALLGGGSIADEMAHVYSRRILECIHNLGLQPPPPATLLLGFGLKDSCTVTKKPETFHEIVGAITELYQDALQSRFA